MRGRFELPHGTEHMRSDCFTNLTEEEQEEIFQNEQSHRLDHIQRVYFGELMMPFAIVGILLSLLYIFVTFKAIRTRKVSRKCYIFLLNRTVGDLFASFTALALSIYVLTVKDINHVTTTTLDTFFVAALYSGMTSYVFLSALKLFAVARPFAYRNFVTLRRCIYLLIVSWIAFIWMILSTLSVIAITNDPILQAWSGCKLETCVRNLYRRRKIFILIAYFVTIFVYILTVLLVRRSQIFSEAFRRASLTENQTSITSAKSSQSYRCAHNSSISSHQHQINLPHIIHTRFPMWKLSLNVFTFTVLHGVMAAWCIATLFVTQRCYFFIHYPEMMFWLGIVRLTLVIRIIVDPLLAFVTDDQLRRVLVSIIGLRSTKGMQWLARTGRFQQEYNSSDAVVSSRSRPSIGPRPTIVSIHTQSVITESVVTVSSTKPIIV